MKKKSLMAMGVYILSFVLVNVLVLTINADNPDYIKWVTFFDTVTSLLMAVFLFYLFKNSLKEEWLLFKSEKAFRSIFLWLIAYFTLSIIANVLTMLIGAGASQNQQTAEALLTVSPAVMALNVVILSPFVEEIVFRFAIFKLFGHRFRSVVISIVIFALAHVVMAGDYLTILPYLFMGGVFAFSYYKTRTIWVPVIIHTIANGLAVLSIFS